MLKIVVGAWEMMRRFAASARAHGREIAYYGGVALALTAIAFAAEQYRGGRGEDPAAPALPVVELSVPAEAEEEEDAFHAPEGAEILRAYAAEPEWNGSLGLWETHAAVDYRLEGDEVVCLGAGVVCTVGRSGVYGGFVEVDCGDVLLRYASIAPRAGLAPGDALEAGDAIGTADASMPGEAGIGAHLHLEAVCGGAYEDFTMRAGGGD